MRRFFLLFGSIISVLIVFSTELNAQYVIDDSFDGVRPLSSYAEYVNLGAEDLSITEVRSGQLPFKSLAKTGDFGFTDDHFWLRFSFLNAKEMDYTFFVETARPITDEVTLYLFHEDGNLEVQESGDKIPFKEKAVQQSRSFFKIALKAGERVEAYIHVKSDGESLVLPLNAYSAEALLETGSQEKMFYGMFYGILLLAAIIYLFFFFGLRDKTFLYYSLYVIFIGLMQFSVDGFSHQYVLPEGGWLNDRIVLIMALIATFFLGKYGSVFLNISSFAPKLNQFFNVVFVLVGLSFICLILIPGFLKFCYPIANILGLLVLILLISSIIASKRIKQKVDPYFIAGIGFLVMGFVVFILHNFNSIPNSFFSQNGPKFGTGLEVIFLSISMSNRIRNLRVRSEENQRLALQRERDLNEMKSSFISNISHELRTPLNLIMGLTSSLYQAEKEQGLKGKYGLMMDSSRQLLGLIEDILNYTEIEKGEQSLKKESFHLELALEDVHDAIRQKAETKGLHLDWSVNGLPSHVLGDKEKVVQVLFNLLDNAVKFTEMGEVSCAITGEQKNGKVSLSILITDSGPGIPEDKMSTVFESFTKKSFRDKREFAGLGLGLFVAKSFVDLLNGSLELKNRANGGLQCQVEMDLEVIEHVEVVAEDTAPLSTDQPSQSVQRKLLLVEDNPMNQMLMKMLVQNWPNTEMQIANNGKEGIEMLQKQHFDLVLMDLQMPVMDGFEATEGIRTGMAGERNMSIPIIAVTADITPKTKNQVLQLGANDYTTKPVNEAVLLAKMDALLNRET